MVFPVLDLASMRVAESIIKYLHTYSKLFVLVLLFWGEAWSFNVIFPPNEKQIANNHKITIYYYKIPQFPGKYLPRYLFLFQRQVPI